MPNSTWKTVGRVLFSFGFFCEHLTLRQRKIKNTFIQFAALLLFQVIYKEMSVGCSQNHLSSSRVRFKVYKTSRIQSRR